MALGLWNRKWATAMGIRDLYYSTGTMAYSQYIASFLSHWERAIENGQGRWFEIAKRN